MESELYEKLVKQKAWLWWSTPDRESLSLASVVEGVLSFGSMEDVQVLFHLVGRRQVKEIFFRQITGGRCNYRPQTVHFFRKVFEHDA
mgnify:CR=1 FL=1|jgi:hypothetical protein